MIIVTFFLFVLFCITFVTGYVIGRDAGRISESEIWRDELRAASRWRHPSTGNVRTLDRNAERFYDWDR